MARIDPRSQQRQKPPGRCFSQAFDYLNGLARSGLTVTAYQPSPGMIKAGALAGNISTARAKAIYLAMISHNE